MFFIGAIVGTILGIIIMAIFAINKAEEEQIIRYGAKSGRKTIRLNQEKYFKLAMKNYQNLMEECKDMPIHKKSLIERAKDFIRRFKGDEDDE